ncbi:MAG TPA: HlyD family efflux transporter periplasmic adaptor subunit, partial [Gemmatimonadales bacterium]|nr:HlyD family efflux transporter periplasmic adaptor subunit [Gemmatimonadales bacterium]
MPREAVEAPFLENDPPHWAARGLAYLIVTLFVVAMIGMVLVHVPETVSGRFTLEPVHGTDPVRVLRDGVVTEVDVTEGATVTRGQPLFLFRSPAAGDRSSELRQLEAQARGDSIRLTIATSQAEGRKREDEGEVRRLQRRGDYLRRTLALKNRRMVFAKELADSAASGQRRGLVSKVDASQREFDVLSLNEEIQANENDLDETGSDLARLRQDMVARALEYQNTKRNLEESIETSRIRAGYLQRDLVNTSDSGVSVTAPCDGTVLRLHASAPGAVVREGDTLAEIACAGDSLQGALVLPEAGVPLVHPGQSVKLRFDAFPYQRYGVRFGTVRWLGPSGITPEDGESFRALVNLADTAIRVRGVDRPLL